MGLQLLLPDKPLAVHFSSVWHTFNDLTIMVTEQMCTANPTHRKKQGVIGYTPFESLAPNPLNSHVQ